MKTLIIYYSQHGSTEVVARTLAKELKTDILEVTDLKELQLGQENQHLQL